MHYVATLTIVGSPDTTVQEARERVRSAIRNSGCIFPTKRITVNLATADLKKEGSAFDLPIAVGILLRILKLARTIADLEGADIIGANYLAEAIQYRLRSLL